MEDRTWHTPTNANAVDDVAAVMYNSANIHFQTDPTRWCQVLLSAAAADGRDDKHSAAVQPSAAAHTRDVRPVEHRSRTKHLGSDN